MHNTLNTAAVTAALRHKDFHLLTAFETGSTNDDAKALAADGYKEIVVTGIEIASWGVDLPGKPKLPILLEAICQAVPEMRVRLGSLEPRIITEEFCEKMSQAIGKTVGRGRFGADMQVSLINDGPVTIIVDSKNPV